MTDEKLRPAVNLEGELAEKFNKIKRSLGISSSTDVMRWLITWYHDNKIGEKKTE